MAKDLSPKKYIETYVRKLPIYKCYVNKDWDTAKMAHIFIMRKHSNGNITAGIYLVDMTCLGIKDTFFVFNESEISINEKFDLPNFHMKVVDYNLAHNIVFAAHDYALDYDIKPHSDFAVTKFILEEDDDNIPLIEITCGGPEGKPHLILQPGQFAKYKHVYDKLVKTLGKDNFYYTMEADMFNNMETSDDLDDSNDDEYTNIDDIPPGKLNMIAAKMLDISDLANADKTSNRSIQEIITLNIEFGLRVLKVKRKELFYSDEELENKSESEIYIEADQFPSWLTNDMMDEASEMMEHDIEAYAQFENDPNSENKLLQFDHERLIANFDKFQHNPYIIQLLYEKSVLINNTEVINLLKPVIKKLAFQYVSLKLEFALCTYYLNETDPAINYIIEGIDLQKIFPATEEFSDMELNIFSMLRLLVNIRNNNLKDAIYYYNLLADIEMETPMITILQMKFQEFILEPFKEVYQELTEEFGEEKMH